MPDNPTARLAEMEAKLRQLDETMTPGEWAWGQTGSTGLCEDGIIVNGDPNTFVYCESGRSSGMLEQPDADGIIKLRNLLPTLVALLAAARAEVERLKAQRNDAMESCVDESFMRDQDIDCLRTQNAELRAGLAVIEWGGHMKTPDGDMANCCPCCRGLMPDGMFTRLFIESVHGHAAGCRLAALLIVRHQGETGWGCVQVAVMRRAIPDEGDAMKLYQIFFDGEPYWVEAESLRAAATKWLHAMKDEWGSNWAGNEEPESIALMHDGPVIR